MSFMEQYLAQLGGLMERCKLPKRCLGYSPSGNRISCILPCKYDIWWHQFFIFLDRSLTFPKNIAQYTLIGYRCLRQECRAALKLTKCRWHITTTTRSSSLAQG